MLTSMKRSNKENQTVNDHLAKLLKPKTLFSGEDSDVLSQSTILDTSRN